MKEFRNITNRDEIVSELASILQEFDKRMCEFQNDVYLFIDEETGAATLDTLANPGGSSFFRGNCIFYSDKGCGGSIYDSIEDLEDFAYSLDMDFDVLKSETVQYLIDKGSIDEEERDEYELDYWDIYDYINSREDYVEKITASYYELIDEERCVYIDRADWLIEQAEAELSKYF